MDFFVLFANNIATVNQKNVAFPVEKKPPVDFKGQISRKIVIIIGSNKLISKLNLWLNFMK